MHHSDKDPIIAVATAAGRGGIGILRLSFGKALEAQIVGRLFGENCTLKARYAHLLPFLGTDGGVLDRAIVLLFPAPHSYTGESVLEIQAHGGPVLLSLIMRTCLEKCRDLGLRMAEPGEFTRRAFMNGRMDLTQAEAVADLIDAVSESAVQAAGRSLSGEFSNAVRDVDGNITELRAFIEATLDFPEEDIDVIGSEKVRTRLVQAETGIRAILENARQGQVLREGVTVRAPCSPCRRRRASRSRRSPAKNSPIGPKNPAIKLFRASHFELIHTTMSFQNFSSPGESLVNKSPNNVHSAEAIASITTTAVSAIVGTVCWITPHKVTISVEIAFPMDGAARTMASHMDLMMVAMEVTRLSAIAAKPLKIPATNSTNSQARLFSPFNATWKFRPFSILRLLAKLPMNCEAEAMAINAPRPAANAPMATLSATITGVTGVKIIAAAPTTAKDPAIASRPLPISARLSPSSA